MTLMRGLAPVVLCALAGVPAASAEGEAVMLPSGLEVRFHDRPRGDVDDPALYRMRFVAPAIAMGAADFDSVMQDMDYLCTHVVLPTLAGQGEAPGRVIVTLMSEPTEFGFANPAVTQFFESYSVENDLCIWEAF